MPGSSALYDSSYLIDVARAVERGAGSTSALTGGAVSVVACGELLVGLELSTQPEKERRRLDSIESVLEKLPSTEETSRHYAIVYAGLRRIGRPIPLNDMWIAACALEHDLILHTIDAHFAYVSELKAQSSAAH